MKIRLILMMIALLIPALLSGLVLPGAAQTDPADTPGFSDLDEVLLGDLLVGPVLSSYDFKGRIVICFHWCITCPISTGAFSYINRLHDRYRDRGVRVVGFQVRRDPEVKEENVMYYLQHLKPNFPVTRRGWVCEWPVKYLPWAVVFDHTGKKIFAHNLPGIEKVIEAALARAPDYQVGGPYKKLEPLAARMAGDREHLGKHMVALRAILHSEDPEAVEEARAMVASLERFYRHRVARAGEDVQGVVEKAEIFEALAGRFRGDALGDRAAKRWKALTSAPGFENEQKACTALARARQAFRKLTPAGRYAYNMDYTLSRNKDLLARRARVLAEFRLALKRIVKNHPGTRAASLADDLLFQHEMPDLDRAQAEERLRKADERVQKAATPLELYDGYLQVYEVVEGYLESNALSQRAAELLAALERNPALAAARETFRRLHDEAQAAMDEVRRGGSALLRKEAGACITRLRKTAARAGSGSRLATAIESFVQKLLESYEGSAYLGVVFDRSHEGKGARIRWIYPRSAAHRHGLRQGDVILEVEGREIQRGQALNTALRRWKPGRKVKMKVQRAGQDNTLEILDLVLGRRI